MACFGGGYIHGLLPEYQLQFLFYKTEKLKIVVFDRELLPPQLGDIIREVTQYPVEIEEIDSWEKLRLKTIINPGPHLLFLPSYWIPPLITEGRIRNLNPLREVLEKKISEEFQINYKDKIYEAPLFWTATHFFTFDENEKSIQQILTYKDNGLERVRQQDQIWLNEYKFKKITPTNSLIHPVWPKEKTASEISIHLIEKDKAKRIRPMSKDSIFIFSFAVPNNTPNKFMSFKLLQTLLSNPKILERLKENPLGTTLDWTDKSFLSPLQIPEAIKNIPLKEYRIIDSIKM